MTATIPNPCGASWAADYGPLPCDRPHGHDGMHRTYGSQGPIEWSTPVPPASAPAATAEPENPRCGSQGVDDDGLCVRCGLVPSDAADLDDDANNCPPGFLTRPAAPGDEEAETDIGSLLDDLTFSYLRKGEGFMVPGVARLRVEAFVTAQATELAALRETATQAVANARVRRSYIERAEKAEDELAALRALLRDAQLIIDDAIGRSDGVDVVTALRVRDAIRAARGQAG